MKKDFSQPLRGSDTTHSFCLLIQDNITQKFLVTCPDDPNEDDFYNTLSFRLEKDMTGSLAHELVKFLYLSYGYSLTHFRELVCVTDTGWSFIDGTPGSYSSKACLLAAVDITDNAVERVNGEVRSWVELQELLRCLQKSPYGDVMAKLGIAQLIKEVDVLGYTW